MSDGTVESTASLTFLAQTVNSVPVVGGGVSRQLEAGATVSLLGTIHQNIDVDVRPALSSGEAALLAGTLGTLDFELGLDADPGGKRRSPSYATFAKSREVLAGMAEFDCSELAAAVNRCPRTIQMAFCEYARTTPYRYFRNLQLHRAREALVAGPGDRAETIGDSSLSFSGLTTPPGSAIGPRVGAGQGPVHGAGSPVGVKARPGLFNGRGPVAGLPFLATTAVTGGRDSRLDARRPPHP